MPQMYPQLTLELSRRARLSSLEDSLPDVLRCISAAAILVGEENHRATNGHNISKNDY